MVLSIAIVELPNRIIEPEGGSFSWAQPESGTPEGVSSPNDSVPYCMRPTGTISYSNNQLLFPFYRGRSFPRQTPRYKPSPAVLVKMPLVKAAKMPKPHSPADYSIDVRKKLEASHRTGQACDRCRVWASGCHGVGCRC